MYQQPPPPYAPYPQQLPPRSKPRWTTGGMIVGGVLVACALMCLCSGVISSLARLQASQRPTTTQPAPPATSTATPKPAPTATPSGPHIVEGGLIGGTLDDFTAAFGPRVSVSGAGQSIFHATTASGYDLTICLCSAIKGTDGKDRAEIVGIGPRYYTHWSSNDQRDAIVRTFMPPDATYVQDVQDPEVGVLHLYHSADLEAAFPADAFTSSGPGPVVTPGTFTLSCDDPYQSVGCQLVLGD